MKFEVTILDHFNWTFCKECKKLYNKDFHKECPCLSNQSDIFFDTEFGNVSRTGKGPDC